MPQTRTPLRYPGGKTQLTKFVQHTIEINNMVSPIYCEPFCGGAGVAIDLLLGHKVDSIILNDPRTNRPYCIAYTHASVEKAKQAGAL